MSEERPKLAVLSVCHHEGRFLMVQRRNPPDAGLWGFPGGHVEFGETLAVAAERELLEETAVTATAGGVLDHIEMITHENSEVTHHFLLVAIRCQYRAGQALAGDDAMAVRWMTAEDIASGALTFSEHVLDLAQRALAVL